MNKAFIREPDNTADYCPRCGSKGETVGGETLKSFLTEEQRRQVADPANYCPAAGCEVVYFDAFERTILITEIDRPIYPKDPDAPLCPCFGLSRADIEQDVAEGVTTRVKAILQKAKSPAAHCHETTPNGVPCVAYVQKYYMQCLNSRK